MTRSTRFPRLAMALLFALTVLTPLGNGAGAQEATPEATAGIVAESTEVPVDPTPTGTATAEPPATGTETPSPAATVSEPAGTPAETEIPAATATAVTTEPVPAVETTPDLATPVAETPAPSTATVTATATATPAPVVAASLPAISVAPATVKVGYSVKATITGYPANATVTIRWKSTVLTSGKTDGAGNATITFKVPDSVAGSARVYAISGVTNRYAVAKVVPSLSRSIASGTPGASVRFALRGFSGGEGATLTWPNGSQIAKTTVNSIGTGSALTKVPGMAAGTYTVTATGSKGHRATTTFVVLDPDPAGTVAITTKDASDAPLSGACYQLFTDVIGVKGASLATRCDDDDGAADGLTTFAKVKSGTVFVVQVAVPDGFAPASDQQATVVSNVTSSLTFINEAVEGLNAYAMTIDGQALPGACFVVTVDIGGGIPGTQIGAACDGDDGEDGATHFDGVTDGDYVLIERVTPPLYARPAAITFSIAGDGGKSILVPHASGGAVVVTTVDEVGTELDGACYDAYTNPGGGALGTFIERQCNEEGSIVTIPGLGTGDYWLVQTKAPYGFGLAARVSFAIVGGHDTALTVVDPPTSKAVIRKLDPTGALIKGSCFQAYIVSGASRGAKVGSEVCDRDFRTEAEKGDDGYVYVYLPAGTFYLAETEAPAGFLLAPDTRITMQRGFDTAVNITDPLGASISIETVDSIYSFIVPTDACYTAWLTSASAPSMKITQACDGYDGKADGVTLLRGLPTGNYVIEQSKTPWGYFDANDQHIDVVAPDHYEMTFANEHWPEVDVHKVDESGKSLGGACFDFYSDLGGGQRGSKIVGPGGSTFCTGDDGLLIMFITPGDHILVETESPLGYMPAADKRFSTVRGQIAHVTVENAKSGRITVNKVDKDTGLKLTAACFEAYANVNGTRGALKASACDREMSAGTLNPTLDGVTVLNGLPAGKYLVAERVAPKGYYLAADTPVTVSSGEIAITVKDERWSTYTITKVDDIGIVLTESCFQLYTVNATGGRGLPSGGRVCGDGKETMVIGAAAGSYLLAEVVTPIGYLTAADQKITFVRGTDKTLHVVDMPAGELTITKIGVEDTKPFGACWQLWTVDGDKRGLEVAEQCAKSTGAVVTLYAKPGTYWLVESKAPEGYLAGADQKVTLVARDPLVLEIPNTPMPRVAIQVVSESDAPLTGACFDLYLDGGITLGAKVESNLCDKTDRVPEDGTVAKRIAAGRYVARMTDAPVRYALAADIKFTIEENTDLTMTLHVQLGGILQVSTTDRAALPLKGACYELWTKTELGAKGVLVRKQCDTALGGDGLQNGITTIIALTPGEYILSESVAPAGYERALDRTVTVVAGEETPVIVLNDNIE